MKIFAAVSLGLVLAFNCGCSGANRSPEAASAEEGPVLPMGQINEDQPADGQSEEVSGLPATAGQPNGQLTPRLSKISEDASKAALPLIDEYAEILNFDPQKAPGSPSPALVEPFPVLVIGLNHLKETKDNEGPGALPQIRSAQDLLQVPFLEVIVPVTAVSAKDGPEGPERPPVDAVHGAMTLERDADGQWRPVAFGNETLARRLVQIREALAANSERSKDSYFTLFVTGLNRNYVGFEEGSAPKLVPVFDDTQLDWKQGQVIGADQVIAALRELAQSASGEFPTSR